MGLIKGISYNIRGLALGVRTPKLLVLGLIRFLTVVAVTVLAAGIILYYHDTLMGLLWPRPENRWLVWLWYPVSWLLSLALMGLSAVIAYLISQVLFCVVIMDQMSRITERMTTGEILQDGHSSWWRQLFYLIGQEIPRAVVPVLLTLTLTLLGWLTPFGPFTTIVLAGLTVVFIAWDSTDLTPARRMRPFSERLRFLFKTLPFHLGFGILFLIPLINILFLAFAPVGATLYYLSLADERPGRLQ